ncbi:MULTISPECIES: glycosyltransferase family 92 protein [Rhizobiaceae]|jgi:hypothetical protein|uniref:Glycosyltransferase family 92 protein n=1 Tax=Aliirhizobium cellulosilyticum TaxID=393664 RepID=A0A7W6S4W6_9HYPH|nr:glycosyltransferase family 92 protein [Rhizobium cellulosilyticum]MBB4347243.1 hypothetical protein [Rhizobium cellulosilyticum]MBB4410363.1 hypothetical protein [Rhizobium cellulosilyticum]MBB4445050.1 hypothetical protein [Rhizobium cellulosilyticum]
MRFFKKKHPYTKQLTITPPEPDPGRAGVAIVTCVKNEARYIAEWIEFHRAVGVVHFYIYDDGCEDDTIPIAREILGSSALTVVPWKGRLIDTPTQNLLNSQAIAFAHSILNFGGQYARMAFIDVDEFLLPKIGNTLDEALEGAKGFPNISLPWHMFGTSGHKARPAGSLLRNYTVRGANPLSTKKNASNFKCIVDPCAVSEVSIHHFSTGAFGENTSNDRGEVFSRKGRKGPAFYSSDFIQLNHYYSKSEQDLREKIERGPASPASRQRYEDRVLSAVRNIESETVVDTAMIEFLDRREILPA